MKSTTVSFINFTDIANHLQLTVDEMDAVYKYGFSNVSWGDAAYTLIGNNYAVRCIVNALMAYYDELNDNDGDIVRCIVSGVMAYYDELDDNEGDIPPRSIPDRILIKMRSGTAIRDRILTEDEVCTKFWEIVGQWDYVNLEN